jgi:hypothetical protein
MAGLRRSCWKSCVCMMEWRSCCRSALSSGDRTAIEVVEEPLPLPAQALAVEPRVKRPRVERLPAVAREAAQAEQESAASWPCWTPRPSSTRPTSSSCGKEIHAG